MENNNDDLIRREDALMCLIGSYFSDQDYKIDKEVAKFIRRIIRLPSVLPKMIEKKTPKICEGDEVEVTAESSKGLRYVVFSIDHHRNLTGLSKDGNFYCWNEKFCKRTGRHFDSVKTFLGEFHQDDEKPDPIYSWCGSEEDFIK